MQKQDDGSRSSVHAVSTQVYNQQLWDAVHWCSLLPSPGHGNAGQFCCQTFSCVLDAVVGGWGGFGAELENCMVVDPERKGWKQILFRRWLVITVVFACAFLHLSTPPATALHPIALHSATPTAQHVTSGYPRQREFFVLHPVCGGGVVFVPVLPCINLPWCWISAAHMKQLTCMRTVWRFPEGLNNSCVPKMAKRRLRNIFPCKKDLVLLFWNVCSFRQLDCEGGGQEIACCSLPLCSKTKKFFIGWFVSWICGCKFVGNFAHFRRFTSVLCLVKKSKSCTKKSSVCLAVLSVFSMNAKRDTFSCSCPVSWFRTVVRCREVFYLGCVTSDSELLCSRISRLAGIEIVFSVIWILLIRSLKFSFEKTKKKMLRKASKDCFIHCQKQGS